MRPFLDLEVSILRTIMEANSASKTLLKSLSPEHFTCRELGTIFLAMQAMWEKSGRVPDHQTVLASGQFQELEGMALIDEPEDAVPARRPLKSKNAIKSALNEMEANLAVRGVLDRIDPLYSKLSNGLDSMSADDKLKLVDEFKRRAEAIPTDGASGLSKPEKIRALLDRSFGNRLSYEVVREKLEISSKELTKIATREEDKEEPNWRREKTPNDKYTGYLVLTRGLHMVRMLDLSLTQDRRIDAAYLPPSLHQHIAPQEQSLGQHAFVMVCAWTDGLKTNFLIECAAANAKMGKRVLFINHELDDMRLLSALASRQAGRRIRDLDEAKKLFEEATWCRNIQFMNIRQAVSLDELCDNIKKLECDVVVWDYLALPFLLVDIGKQTSGPAVVVQTIGVQLVDAGIPVITGIQTQIKDSHFPTTWTHRATCSLILKDREAEGNHIRCTYYIHKNKEGGATDCYMDIYFDDSVLNIIKCRTLSKLEWAVRQENKQKQMRERAKEEYEAGSELEPNGSDKPRRRKKNKQAEDAKPLPWKPDADELVRRAAEEL